MKHTILVAEDDPLQRQTIVMMLTKKMGYAAISVANGKDAVERIQASEVGEISAILLDIQMPIMDGFETLKYIRKYRPDLPVLILTGSNDTSVAVRAIKEGANDFIVKPAEPDHLNVALQNAIRISSLSQELSRLKRDKAGALAFNDLVGYNSGLAEVVAIGRKAAASNVPVLIMGETGVGKEMFARAIHGESKRVGEPFVAINCGAIPTNLVESTLFGHEKGAFTGAVNRSIGKFREADGGTILLDEVGELPREAQVKLLRVLQQQEVEPVGASKPVKVNIRIISATNRDMKREVEAERFREDLYFRLNVLPITMPALRERAQDILLLTDDFIQRIAATDGLPIKPLSEDAKHYLKSCAWRGNVRELHNLMHRALVLADYEIIDRATLLQLHDVSGVLAVTEQRSTANLQISLSSSDGKFKTMSEIENETLQTMLSHFDQNITKAAEALGIAKSTFYRKIKDID